MFHILKCSKCKSYGLGVKCGCGGTRSKPKPPKYSPEDKYGEYRRKYKEEHGDDQKVDDEKEDEITERDD